MPTLLGMTVSVVGAVLAAIGDWCAIAIYGIGFASLAVFLVTLVSVEGRSE